MCARSAVCSELSHLLFSSLANRFRSTIDRHSFESGTGWKWASSPRRDSIDAQRRLRRRGSYWNYLSSHTMRRHSLILQDRCQNSCLKRRRAVYFGNRPCLALHAKKLDTADQRTNNALLWVIDSRQHWYSNLFSFLLAFNALNASRNLPQYSQ